MDEKEKIEEKFAVRLFDIHTKNTVVIKNLSVTDATLIAGIIDKAANYISVETLLERKL